MLGPDRMWSRIRKLKSNAEAADALRRGQQARRIEHRRIIKELIKKAFDEDLQIWIQIRIGGERRSDVARSYGYRDGSGTYRVVERVEARAESDKHLSRYLRTIRSKVQR